MRPWPSWRAGPMADDLIGRLRGMAGSLAVVYPHMRPTADAMAEAAALIEECRRTIDLSRVWWDDNDPYHAPWSHGIGPSDPCTLNPCAACQARAAAMAILARLGGGHGDQS